MSTVLTAHLAFGVLLFIVALAFGWGQSGRRILAAALSVELVLGLLVVHSAATSRLPLPPMLWVHIASAMIAAIAYLFARRSTYLSLTGLLLIAFTLYYGRHLFVTHGL